MARHERGVYEPSDEVRVFDGAEEEDDAEVSRLPLLIVLALLVLFAFAGVVWLAYTQGVARGRTETPVLAAANGPEKVAPQNAGGANVQYQGFKIYEQPAPPDDEADAATPAAPPQQAAKPEPAPVAKTEPPPVAKPEPKPAATPPQVAAKPEAAPKVAAATPVAKPVPAPPAPKPVAVKPPVTPLPAMKQAASPPTPAPTTTVATGAPRTLPGVAPGVAAPAPKPVAVAAAAPKGAFVLQIGAYKSQADADAAWKAYKGKHAALLASYGSDVQKADLSEKGTWYRLRVAGFSDRDVASALCDRLKADGGGGCIVGK